MDYICGQIYDGEIRHACIGIEDGKIAEIRKTAPPMARIRDYGDAIILPAAIDIHVHFREPGSIYKEDFFTGSRAAAIAGVTCVMDMPNNRPAILSAEKFNEKARIVAKKACVDYGLYAGVNKEGYECDCAGYKTFLSADNEIFCSPDWMERLLIFIKKVDKPLAIHAEIEDCIERKKAENLREHGRRRRKECEIEGIKKILEINEKIGAKVHFCHVTLGEAVDLIGNRASFGSTLHHLLFSTESRFTYEAMGKTNPPLREERERRKLYERFQQGRIPILESDHAPHLIEEKEEFESAPSGMPGVDAMLPIMLDMVRDGKVEMEAMLNMMGRNPAKLFGLNKGAVETGRDADLIIVDFSVEHKIKPLSKCGWSAYEGMKCIYPMDVYLRGERIVESHEFIGKGGMGRMIT